ncbi:MAG: hypothetical protein HOV80_00830 [Polyangiaceae bacterium]|nr:hypothetical protein [Polyangiaceae bacterium]
MTKRQTIAGSALLGATLLAWATLASAGDSGLPDKFKRSPWSLRTLSVGAPNDGTLVRGRKLRPSPAARMWNKTDLPAHATPDLLKAIDRAAKKVRKSHHGGTLLVLALSNQKGGPLPERRSHQTGRDADLVFYALDTKGNPASSKKLARFGGDGVSRDKKLRFDDARNWALVEALAKDPAGVTHIFVDAKIRVRLLAFAEKEGLDEERTEKVRAVLFEGDSTEELDAYFHVRIGCPEGQGPICKG